MRKKDREPLVVAIDGPAASGKSTVAGALARRLAQATGEPWAWLDSGALYRAVTVEALREGVDPADVRRVVAIARRVRPRLVPETGRVFLGRRDVTRAIRTEAVTAAVSQVARIPGVRRAMGGHQRRFAERNRRVVADGRDMGTVVFPHAPVKVFLKASISARARRRWAEMGGAAAGPGLHEVAAAIRARDRTDRGRRVAPLAAAEGAVVLDTTRLTRAGVLSRLLALVLSRIPPAAVR